MRMRKWIQCNTKCIDGFSHQQIINSAGLKNAIKWQIL